jgi:thiol-disulfide isomerase/thioredoxin
MMSADMRITSWARRATRAASIAAVFGLSFVAATGTGALQAPTAAAAPIRRAWLGIELGKGPAGGVVARHVARTSPADVAGVKDGDQIVAVDGKPIDVPRELIARIMELGPDQSIKLRLRRGGAESDVVAKLLAHPGDEEILRRDKVGTFAPDWGQLTSTSGVLPASVTALRGRVAIIDFWASWCGPCKLVSPTLSSLQDKYGAQGLTVVGISNDPPDVGARAASGLGVRYATGVEKTGEASSAYGVRAIPTMYVVDKKGAIREVFIGFHPAHAGALEKLVQQLLAEPAPVTAPTPPRPAPPPKR